MSKQPARNPEDGEVSIKKLSDGKYMLSVDVSNRKDNIVVSGFNAWRLFGMLAIVLGIKLPESISKKIILSEND